MKILNVKDLWTRFNHNNEKPITKPPKRMVLVTHTADPRATLKLCKHQDVASSCEICHKPNESSGGYMSVDRTEAIKANWERIQNLTLPGTKTK